MNRLQLVNALVQETGNESFEVDSTNSTNPEFAKYITWIDRAYMSIQTKPVRWRWMLKHAEVALYPPKVSYSPAEMSLTNVKDYLYNSFSVKSEYKPIHYCGLTEYNGRYRDTTLVSDFPEKVYIDNDKTLIFCPEFTEQCVALFDYFQYHTMTQDTDSPIIPEPYHELILFLASRYAAVRDNNPELFQDSEQNYRQLYRELYKRESLVLR